jgi:hypothetical protein
VVERVELVLANRSQVQLFRAEAVEFGEFGDIMDVAFPGCWGETTQPPIIA